MMLTAALGAAGCGLVAAQSLPGTSPARLSAGPYTDIQRGLYLVRAGDCRSCHTAPNGQPFAGGRAVPTPFGTIYSTNITPDAETGIGQWTDADFLRAMHHGIDREGRQLYPAFPYPWYTKVAPDDVAAIKAYLDTLEPVRSLPRDNELPWPLNMRTPVAAWDWLFLDTGVYQDNPQKSDAWNRGAYLVEGLGHCSACHGDKNLLGATDKDHPFGGGYAENVFAPSLTGGTRDGLGAWSEDDIVRFLKTGSNGRESAAGPMAEVVEMSTQYLTEADLRAIATYLKDLPGGASQSRGDDSRTALASDDSRMQHGAALYYDNCRACHMDGGTGQPQAFPPLKDSSSIQAEHADTLIDVILNGARKPVTDGDFTGLQMPGFAARLDDGEIADLVTYVRNGWGNSAGAVSSDTVAQLRSDTRHGGGDVR
ncbi:MAG: cytochrome c [Xanthomonadales bacterium]|nr:cytochrome c [Xanthomonadales bacterium]